NWTSGAHSVSGPLTPQTVNANGRVVNAENIQALGQAIYTRYLLPFEMTSALLVIAVVAAVVLARSRERVAGELARSDQAQRRSVEGDADVEDVGLNVGGREQ